MEDETKNRGEGDEISECKFYVEMYQANIIWFGSSSGGFSPSTKRAVILSGTLYQTMANPHFPNEYSIHRDFLIATFDFRRVYLTFFLPSIYCVENVERGHTFQIQPVILAVAQCWQGREPTSNLQDRLAVVYSIRNSNNSIKPCSSRRKPVFLLIINEFEVIIWWFPKIRVPPNPLV